MISVVSIGDKRSRIGEPPRAEIPAALGAGANIAINLLGRPLRRRGQHDVLAIGFIARRVAVVPIAIEDRPVVESDRMAMRAARLELVRALHPERVFRLQFRQIAGEGRRRIRRRQEPDHFEKERRLRSSEVIGARSVRRMAVCVNQIGEVLRHVLEQILSAALSEAEHGEIRVPVIKLTESAARHDIRPRQRQQRGIGRHGRLLAGQQRPQGVDVPADGNLFGRRLRRRGLVRQLEMRDDEALQPLERIRLLRVVERHNLGRRRLWRRVGELLAVGKTRSSSTSA